MTNEQKTKCEQTALCANRPCKDGGMKNCPHYLELQWLLFPDYIPDESVGGCSVKYYANMDVMEQAGCTSCGRRSLCFNDKVGADKCDRYHKFHNANRITSSLCQVAIVANKIMKDTTITPNQIPREIRKRKNQIIYLSSPLRH